MPWESSKRRKDPPYWKALRLQIIERAQGQCEHTPLANDPPPHGRCPFPGRDVDHIINLAQGGDDSPTNLQLLCEWHHKQKTQREARANRTPRTEKHPGEKHPGIL